MIGRKQTRPATVLFVVLTAALIIWQVHTLSSVPTHLRLFPGQIHEFSVGFPLTLNDLSASPIYTREGSCIQVDPGKVGKINLELRLLGLFPIRSVVVDVVEEQKVVPGGEAIGVLLSPQGLIVLETLPFEDVNGRQCHPSRDAGIKPGDILLSIAGQNVRSVEQVAHQLNRYGPSGRPVPIELKRSGKIVRVLLSPAKVWDERGFRYMMGARLDTPTAGVGTLTFFDPRTKRFGAVGHLIANTATGTPLEVDDGRIVKAYISGIRQGLKGRPGEKQGIFQDERDVIGVITKNTAFGIYGHLIRFPGKPKEEVPVALTHQVKEGPATILTVLDGEHVEEFTVRIDKVARQTHPNSKGLVLTITDPRLLARAGGIVQGMSGSPILQGGRLAGAVTHVFMNDPARGFGVLAEWMVYEAGIVRESSGRFHTEGKAAFAGRSESGARDLL